MLVWILLCFGILDIGNGLLYPEQIRLSWTENENEMRVTWITNIHTNTYVKYRPILCSDISSSD